MSLPIDRVGPNAFPTTIHPEMTARVRAEERAQIEAAIAKRKQREQEHAEALEQKRLSRAADDLEAFKETQRQRWIDATGSVSGFEAAWPQLRTEYALNKMTAVEQAKAELRATHGTL
jgi:hypothetical protein